MTTAATHTPQPARCGGREGEQRAMDTSALIKILSTKIDDFPLSCRASNLLKSVGIKNIFDLVQFSEPQLLHSHMFGLKSINEVKTLLSGLGLSLNGELPPVDFLSRLRDLESRIAKLEADTRP